MIERKIYIPLSQAEHEALFRAAQREYRRPSDQARVILRRVLLGDYGGAESPPTTRKETGDAAEFSKAHGATLTTNP